MSSNAASSPTSRPRYQGTSLLASGTRRVLYVLPLVAGLWALCAWALEWWHA